MITLILSILVFIVRSILADDCNPLITKTCPPIRGLGTTTYSVDFTTQTSLPAGWILADYANVTFTPQGAKFWFNQRGQAPYIWTDFYLAYGRVDVELMVANGTGIITSSVLFSDTQDEIDWEFSGSNFASSTGKAYTNYFGKGITGNYDRGSQQDVSEPQKTFHTYSFDWTPQKLKWIIDGDEKKSVTNNGLNTGNYQYPQTPSRLHLGLWDAGDPNTAGGTVNWAGGYTSYSYVPYLAIIKSVKITTPFPCKSWQYPSKFGGKWADVKCANDTIVSIITTSLSKPTSTSPNTKCTASVYTVGPADYGYGIASKFGLDYPALCTANPRVGWDSLLIGQVLSVPCNITATTTASSSSSTSSSPTSAALATSASTNTMTTGSSIGPGTTVVFVTSGATVVTTIVTGTAVITAFTGSSTVVSTVTATPSSPSSSTANNAVSSTAGFTLLSSTLLRSSSSSSSSSSSFSSFSSMSTSSVVSIIGPVLPPLIRSSSTSISSVSITSQASTITSNSSTAPYSTTSNPALPSGWTYRGCATDQVSSRALSQLSSVSPSDVNSIRCITWCDSKGYALAGTEYSRECFCGSQLNNSTLAQESDCNMKCSNGTEMCGGPNRLSLFSKGDFNVASFNSTSRVASSSSSSSSASSVPTTLTTVTKTSSSPSNTDSITPITSGSSSISTASSTAATIPTVTTSLSKSSLTVSMPTSTNSGSCSIDKCLNGLRASSTDASKFCSSFLKTSTATTTTATTSATTTGFSTICENSSQKISSACSCLLYSTTTITSTTSIVQTPYISIILPNTPLTPTSYSSIVLANKPIISTSSAQTTSNIRGGSVWSNWARNSWDRKRDLGNRSGRMLRYGGDGNGGAIVDRPVAYDGGRGDRHP